ncbi:endoribonuclease rege-1 [Diachasma alloeum]|uniref:endoribonuclease rege-1 n=1 Tax=Diachasma alloeum TaxID=454923 RepID=UPI000738385A|nr:endoribonuclease rege-1 [Diachasma alloeum]XP_015121807.1 endoribonuclease rege-1 [Diachasma alloeum]
MMNLLNESVIIVDSPEVTGTMARKRRPGAKKPVTRSDTLKKRSPGGKEGRSPLRTVYESLTRKVTGSCDVIPITVKRKRDLSNSQLTPKLKKKCRKSEVSENLRGDESVIVLSDDDDIQTLPVAPGPSDMIPLVEPPAGSPKTSATSKPPNPKKTPKRLSKKQRQIQRKEKPRKNGAEKSQERNDDVELEIVWSSEAVPEDSPRPAEDNPPINETTENPGGNDSFFVDVAGDTSLLLIDSLGLDNSHPDEKFKVNKKQKKTKKKKEEQPEKLREIIIDGCNVAMAHANSNGFSEQGLKIVLDYFLERGHKVTIFIPQHKRCKDRQLIEKWNREGIVVFTPSRKVANKFITPYDDRYILEYATKCQGIVISSDQFRDLWTEKPEWRETIEKRLLAPTFVGDYLMFPDDPLGKFGPRLNTFLKF